jgi:hypothetical protein
MLDGLCNTITTQSKDTTTLDGKRSVNATLEKNSKSICLAHTLTLHETLLIALWHHLDGRENLIKSTNTNDMMMFT